MTEPHEMADVPVEGAQPFVAPCRDLAINAPFGWIKKGARDMRIAPRQSLTYGAIIVGVSLLVTAVAIRFGGYWLLLMLVSGFIFVAPLLAVGTYAISQQIERGEKPSLRRCFGEERRAFGNLMVFALMAMVVFLVWARAGSAIHVFFPIDAEHDWRSYLRFFGIGSAVGSIFAAVVFSVAAFSLPMIMDRKVDTVTAVVTSVNAVLRNKFTMMVWAAMISLAVAPGFALLFVGREQGAGATWVMLGLGLTLPLIGHATWHAYRETIDASEWPLNVEASTDNG
jgi:uncharacterized membrane protein